MDTRTKILEMIYDAAAGDTSSPLYASKLAQRLSIDKSAVSRHVTKLIENGDVYRQKEGRAKHLYPTEQGRDRLLREKRPPSEGSTQRSQPEEERGRISFHKNSIGFRIQNTEELDEESGRALDWRNRYVEAADKGWEYDATNDTWTCTIQDWSFRLSRENVFVKVGEVVADDIDQAAWSVYDRAIRAKQWLESNSPVRLSEQPFNMKIWTSERHIADIRNPLAEWLRDSTSLKLSSFRVFDDNGELRLWMDDSKEQAHLEAAGQYDEDDMRHLREEYKWKIQNKEKNERLRELPDEMDAVEGDIQGLKEISEHLLRLELHERLQEGRVSREKKDQETHRVRCEDSKGIQVTVDGVNSGRDWKRKQVEKKEDGKVGLIRTIWRWLW